MGQEHSSHRGSSSAGQNEGDSTNTASPPRASRSSSSVKFRKPTTLLRMNKRPSDVEAATLKKAKVPESSESRSRDRLLSCPDLVHHTESEMVKRLEILLTPKVQSDSDDSTTSAQSVRTPAQETAMKLFEGANPPKITVTSYLQRMVYYLGSIAESERKCGVDVNVHSDIAVRYLLTAILYMERIQTRTGMVVTLFNVHRLLITGTMIAAKVLDDFQPNQKYFADLGGVSTLELARLEVAFLTLCDYNVNVNPEIFAAKYASALERDRCFSDVGEALNLGASVAPRIIAIKSTRAA